MTGKIVEIQTMDGESVFGQLQDYGDGLHTLDNLGVTIYGNDAKTRSDVMDIVSGISVALIAFGICVITYIAFACIILLASMVGRKER